MAHDVNSTALASHPSHLFLANEIGLFAAMATGPASLDELAERTGMPRGAIALLADALVTLGIVQKHDDQYSNGVVAAGFLSSSGPGDLRPWLRFFNRLAAPLS